MTLFDYAENFAQLFDSFDAICDYEPEKNEYGQYMDDDGNIIPDLDAFKADMQKAWFDTLDGIEGEFDLKAENIACFIMQLEGELSMLEERKAAFERRRKAKKNRLESLKSYLLCCMQKMDRKLIETPSARISIRSNAPSAKIPDEKAFIEMCMSKGLDDYLRYKDPEINKTAVKDALKAGKAIPGAELGRTRSLVIK